MNRSTQHAFQPEEIMAYLDGELEAHRAAALASHLEHCSECQTVAAHLRQVSDRLLDFQIEPSPAKTAEAALATIEGNIGETSKAAVQIKPKRRRGLRVLVWGSVSAIVLLLVAAIVVPNYLRTRMAALENTPAESERVRLRLYAHEQPAQTSRGGQSVDNARVGGPPPPIHSKGLDTLSGPTDSSDSKGTFQAGRGVVGGAPGGTAGKLQLHAKLEAKRTQGIEAPEIRGPMIVQTASITIQAQNYDQASGQIQPLTSARSGYVQDMTADTRTGTARSVSATLRVPDKQLESFLADLRKLGHVEQETRNNREVTDAYIDLTARLKTSRATEQRVVELLGTRTGKLSDVLEAEQELARIRGEIESMDGQRAHMEHEVRYATVQVQLNEEYREQLNPESFSTGRRLRNSLVEGLGNLAGGITGTAIFVFAYGPSILFWLGVIGIPTWFIWRRFRGTPKKTSDQAV